MLSNESMGLPPLGCQDVEQQLVVARARMCVRMRMHVHMCRGVASLPFFPAWQPRDTRWSGSLTRYAGILKLVGAVQIIYCVSIYANSVLPCDI